MPQPMPTPTSAPRRSGNASELEQILRGLPANMQQVVRKLPSWARLSAARKIQTQLRGQYRGPSGVAERLSTGQGTKAERRATGETGKGAKLFDLVQSLKDKLQKTVAGFGDIPGGGGDTGDFVDPFSEFDLGDAFGGGGAGLTAEELRNISAQALLAEVQAGLLPQEFEFDKEKFAKQYGLDSRQVDELEAAGAFTRGPAFEQQKREALATVMANLLGTRISDIGNRRSSTTSLLESFGSKAVSPEGASLLGRMLPGINKGGPVGTTNIPIDYGALQPTDMGAEEQAAADEAKSLLGLAHGGTVEGSYTMKPGKFARHGKKLRRAQAGINIPTDIESIMLVLLGNQSVLNDIADRFGMVPQAVVDSVMATYGVPAGTVTLGKTTQQQSLDQQILDANRNFLEAQRQFDTSTANQLKMHLDDLKAQRESLNASLEAQGQMAEAANASRERIAAGGYASAEKIAGQQIGESGRQFDITTAEGRRQRQAELYANPRRVIEAAYYQSGRTPTDEAAAMQQAIMPEELGGPGVAGVGTPTTGGVARPDISPVSGQRVTGNWTRDRAGNLIPWPMARGGAVKAGDKTMDTTNMGGLGGAFKRALSKRLKRAALGWGARNIEAQETRARARPGYRPEGATPRLVTDQAPRRGFVRNDRPRPVVGDAVTEPPVVRTPEPDPNSGPSVTQPPVPEPTRVPEPDPNSGPSVTQPPVPEPTPTPAPSYPGQGDVYASKAKRDENGTMFASSSNALLMRKIAQEYLRAGDSRSAMYHEKLAQSMLRQVAGLPPLPGFDPLPLTPTGMARGGMVRKPRGRVRFAPHTPVPGEREAEEAAGRMKALKKTGQYPTGPAPRRPNPRRYADGGMVEETTDDMRNMSHSMMSGMMDAVREDMKRYHTDEEMPQGSTPKGK